MADASMQLPPGRTCADCAHVDRCTVVLGCTSRTALSCDFAPSRFLEQPPKPLPPRNGYVSPLWPPPGDPRAAHGAACPPGCSCHAEIQRRRSRGLTVVDGGRDA